MKQIGINHKLQEENSMASSTTLPALSSWTEDILAYLPISRTTDYDKGAAIYSPNNFSNCIYLVIAGKVGISQIAEDGSEVLLEIVRPEELFGESGFLGVRRRSELATAIEKASVMMLSRVIPGSTEAPSGGVWILPSRTMKILSPDPSLT